MKQKIQKSKSVLRVRFSSVWKILTRRNFILINVDENPDRESRDVSIVCRTDYSTESDLLTMKAGILMIKKNHDNY